MNTNFLKIILANFLLAVTSFANAGLITVNDTTEVGVLTLDESFTSFYDYRNSSAHTGYEKEATAVMFLAESQGDLALFTLLDAGGTNHTRRSAELIISDFDLSNVLLVDEASESTNMGFSWSWVKCCTDGMIYQIIDKDNFDIDFEFSEVVGLANFEFLSFSSNTQLPDVISVSNSFSIQSGQNSLQIQSVPEPSTLAILALGIIGLASRRFKKQF
ncbi:MAG: PEP-CTERM sorting domain-containing protein [Cognaticolwellia sp.]